MESIYCDREKEHLASVRRAKEGALSSGDIEQVCKIFRLLAEPSRMKIVAALLSGEMCVYHLTEVCGGTVSAVSHQLRILRDNGIVKSKRFGKNIEYSIADAHVEKIISMGVAHVHCQE